VVRLGERSRTYEASRSHVELARDAEVTQVVEGEEAGQARRAVDLFGRDQELVDDQAVEQQVSVICVPFWILISCCESSGLLLGCRGCRRAK